MIKFRGKILLSNEWVYGGVTPTDVTWSCAITTERYGFYTKDYVDRDTLGQFIGLYDKNNKEIYEGDVIKDSDSRTAYVKWLNQECGFFLVYKHYDSRITSLIVPYLEVIGNIHDNPDLIENE